MTALLFLLAKRSLFLKWEGYKKEKGKTIEWVIIQLTGQMKIRKFITFLVFSLQLTTHLKKKEKKERKSLACYKQSVSSQCRLPTKSASRCLWSDK